MNDSNLFLGLYSSVAEHWSCKPGVVSSILTGGNFFSLCQNKEKKMFCSDNGCEKIYLEAKQF